MALLTVTQDVRGSAVVVSVTGEVDSNSVAILQPHLDAAIETADGHRAKLLIVELSRVTYFGSAGLNAVLECYEKGLAAGVSVRLVAANPEVVRPIEVTGLDKILIPYANVADAAEDE
ncbi:anti-anti-sigma factor [Mycolicibacterium sp. GF69]|uniref:STAS domain-containing protein n=1 Tax=Mycolicibacterium sp. GF69 TaxID=2267251 RepID=UPI000DCCCF42|nr:STAS domain-containing protein [Mycolicibacterium sp. GF69]RAV10050.1 anti-anti-sigma factor [Mycolicibacterium sp. GF69]